MPYLVTERYFDSGKTDATVEKVDSGDSFNSFRVEPNCDVYQVVVATKEEADRLAEEVFNA